jgi:hypothetical protein
MWSSQSGWNSKIETERNETAQCVKLSILDTAYEHWNCSVNNCTSHLTRLYASSLRHECGEQHNDTLTVLFIIYVQATHITEICSLMFIFESSNALIFFRNYFLAKVYKCRRWGTTLLNVPARATSCAESGAYTAAASLPKTLPDTTYQRRRRSRTVAAQLWRSGAQTLMKLGVS